MVTRLQNGSGYSSLLSRFFVARGFLSAQEIEDYRQPALAVTHDPFELKAMDKAIERIVRAIDREEPIWIYGDYDVDGITATALVKSAFDFLGVAVQTYIPHRLHEGYGLGVESIRRIAGQGAKVIITVDNGTSAIEEIELAVSLGIDVIVTDHHQPGETLPAATALINPKQADCSYPFTDLSGVGVAFKLAHALLRRKAPDPEAAKEFLKSLLDFVALGTVADVVPLHGENRCFVRHGMKILRERPRPGIKSLFDIIGIPVDEIRADRIVFTIAPRLNAAGRTEHAEYALELLLTTDHQKARELAGLLDRFNDDRRRIEADITEEAFGMIDENEEAPVIIAEQEGWHLGVVGIVASRLLERYYRPVIVLGVDGEWAKGSARSIKGFDMYAALTACGDHLEQFGGHTMAAGLRLRTSAIDDFRHAMAQYARSVMTEELLTPSLTIDATATADDLTRENVETLDELGPFGQGNAKPVLAIEGLNLVEEPRTIKGKHLKLRLAGRGGQTIWAIGFSLADRADCLQRRHRNLRLAATPFINTWGGRNQVELQLKDFIVED